jgi:aspartate aminotransferase-like enzyme
VAFGFDDYRERGFRVGHFGAAATWECTAQLLEALGELLAREGRAVGAGAGVAAAEAAFRE